MSLKLNTDIYHAFNTYISNQNLWDLSHPIAVAVSGGPDSMALLAAAHQWGSENNVEVHVLSVDHRLRDAAKDEVAQVGAWVQAQNSKSLHHVILTWEGDKPEAAIMEAARAVRYDLMAQYCAEQNIHKLFVAHHQDDQAETFLIRLSKGSGLDGLSGMNDVRRYNDVIDIVRPFLDIPKADLVACCEEHKIPYASDLSNENPEFMRPRLRQSMAVLAKEGLTNKRLALTAKRLGRVRQALEDITNSAYQGCVLEQKEGNMMLNYTNLKSCPEEIALRVIQKSLESMRQGMDYNVRMEKLEDLFHALWHHPKAFKPRTLGGCKFSLKKKTLKNDKTPSLLALYIEKEDV